MPRSPHDAIFKASFGQADIARSVFDLVLPADVRKGLDLSTLAVCSGSFVDEELQQSHSDLLYAVRTRDGRAGFVYLLFEHQSSPDPTMPFRLLRYVVRVWDRWLRDHPNAKTLPIVIPVVLHHGNRAWRAEPELAAMFNASPELLEAVRPFLPHYRFLLDDLARLSAQDLASRALAPLPRLVQLALWASHSFPRLRRAAPFMRAVIETVGRDERAKALLAQLFFYLLSAATGNVDVRDIRAILLDVAGPDGQEDVMNAADQLRAEGRTEGRVEGRVEALRSAVLGVLAARSLPLSESGRSRVASCSDAPTLTRWLERAATATTEAEVFVS